MTLSPQALSVAIAVPLIALLYYRRLRRLFGRQAVREGRMVARIVILALVGAIFLAASLHNREALLADAGGLVAGAALGWWGLRLTRFERQSDGVHYIPHGWFGIGISALLIGRLIYRFMVLSPAAQQVSQNTGPLAVYQRSPFTLALFGLLVGYYVCYYIGVLRTAKKLPVAAAS